MAISVILSAFFNTLGQIGDPRFRRVLMIGVGLTIALLIGAYLALVFFLQWIGAAEFVASYVGEAGWIGGAINVTSFLLILVMSVFLMVPVASAITSMFLDQVAAAVEDRHYPSLPQADSVAFGDALKDTVNFLGLLIAANVIALLLYLALPFFALFIFWGMNGFLLGREYYTIAAMRRVGREGAKELRRQNIGTIWLAGTLMAIPLSVPLVNLLIPVLGAATFTHIFHQLEDTPRG